jgi:hypothetical protein
MGFFFFIASLSPNVFSIWFNNYNIGLFNKVVDQGVKSWPLTGTLA